MPCMVATAAAPVRGSPLWNWMFGRRLIVHCVKSAFGTKDSARYGWMLPSASYAGQRIVDREGDLVARDGPAVGGRVVAAGLGLDPVHQSTARGDVTLDRLGHIRVGGGAAATVAVVVAAATRAPRRARCDQHCCDLQPRSGRPSTLMPVLHGSPFTSANGVLVTPLLADPGAGRVSPFASVGETLGEPRARCVGGHTASETEMPLRSWLDMPLAIVPEVCFRETNTFVNAVRTTMKTCVSRLG